MTSTTPDQTTDQTTELTTRHLAISVDGGRVWEVRDGTNDDVPEGDIEKTDIRPRYSDEGDVDGHRRGRTFTVPGVQFTMYARLGFHHVVGMDVTDEEFDDVCDRLMALSDAGRAAFGAEKALTPPE